MQQQQQQDVHVAARIRPLLDRDAANAVPGTSSQQGLRVYRDGSIGVLQQQQPQQPTMSPPVANDAGGGVGGVDAIGNPATTFAFDFVFDHSRPAQSSSSHSPASPSSLLLNSVAPATSSTAAANHHNSNAHVVETLLSPLRDAVVQGTNIAVVAYGASGTGKTHTIFGGGGGGNSISDNNSNNDGMAQIFFRQLMEDAVKRKNPFASSHTTFSLSLFELYNEKVRDLVVAVTGGKAGGGGGGAEPQSATLTSSATMSSFAPSSPASPLLSTSASIFLGGAAATSSSSSSGGALRRTATQGTLRGSRHGSHAQSSADLSRAALSSSMDDFRDVKLRSNKLGVVLDGVQRASVATTEDLASLFSQSLGNRLTCAGRQNPRSSQSHAVAQLVMRQEDYAQGLAVVTSVTFVDLAGSERSNRTSRAGGAGGVGGGDARGVHVSLAALRRVIDALVVTHEGGGGSGSTNTVVVPYRESAVTNILSDVLGGNTRLTWIATLSPTSSAVPDSLHTMEFVSLWRSVTTKVSAVTEKLEGGISLLHREISHLKQLQASDITQEATEKQAAALRSELEKVEQELQGAVAGREKLQENREALLTQLQAQDELLVALKRRLSVKEKSAEDAKKYQEELAALTQQHVSNTSQLAQEAMIREKRNAQLTMQRQRQASMVRRHDVVLQKLQYAKQNEKLMRQNAFAGLFRNATILQKQKEEVEWYRRAIRSLQDEETKIFAALRSLQSQSSKLQSQVSEEKLKCEMLTEELRETTDDIVRATEVRDAFTLDVQRFLAKATQERSEARDESQSITNTVIPELQREHQERHTSMMEETAILSQRISESEVTATALERELEAVQKSNELLENDWEAHLNAVRDLPRRQEALRDLQVRYHTLLSAEANTTLDMHSLEEETRALLHVDLEQVLKELHEAEALVLQNANALVKRRSEQRVVEKFVVSQLQPTVVTPQRATGAYFDPHLHNNGAGDEEEQDLEERTAAAAVGSPSVSRPRASTPNAGVPRRAVGSSPSPSTAAAAAKRRTQSPSAAKPFASSSSSTPQRSLSRGGGVGTPSSSSGKRLMAPTTTTAAPAMPSQQQQRTAAASTPTARRPSSSSTSTPVNNVKGTAASRRGTPSPSPTLSSQRRAIAAQRKRGALS